MEAYHAAFPLALAAEAELDVTNSAILDEWTPVHVMSGVLTGLTGLGPALAAGGAVAYEVLEFAHEWPKGSVLFGSKRPESLGNVLSDLVVFAAGYAVGRKLRGDYDRR